MFNKVRRALNPSKSLDPLQYLPLEIAEMICHNLAVRERVTTLTHVKFLHLKGSRLAGAGTWPMLPKLKSLCLKAEGDYLLDVSELAKATSGVMSVALKGWRLQNIHGIEDWTALQDLDLSNTEFSLLPMLPATLRRLILRDSRQLEGFNIPEDSFWVNEVLEASIKHGKLRVLSIGNRLVHEPGHMSAAQWAEEFPLSLTLRELSLAASLLDEAGLMRVVQGYPHLRVLDVSYTNVTGVAVKRFVKILMR
ncbi:hypothetical protein M7I_0394 [Glarea lozoyensis 74030]|uniref:RNI-like protein n=1 Tax=Glarea lozoyensis (strain ATCC 74030 / MF5533) TaxID=1104152 RepID=H0ED90_GLAL7|nr:hypothetical protein M7I_0394 [Glarea lozoyensis 74030]